MFELNLIRHGQAQTGATSEADYDRLSPLGLSQAHWMGQYLSERDKRFERIVSGTLKRQVQTAEIIADHLKMPMSQDPRLNEMDYYGLAHTYVTGSGVGLPNSREEFLRHMPELMMAWSRGEIVDPKESFDAFAQRVRSFVDEMNQTHAPIMAVTSGGVIGMAIGSVKDLSVDAFARLLLQIRNTSLHRVVQAGPRLALDAFNALPHLDHPERQAAHTFT